MARKAEEDAARKAKEEADAALKQEESERAKAEEKKRKDEEEARRKEEKKDEERKREEERQEKANRDRLQAEKLKAEAKKAAEGEKVAKSSLPPLREPPEPFKLENVPALSSMEAIAPMRTNPLKEVQRQVEEAPAILLPSHLPLRSKEELTRFAQGVEQNLNSLRAAVGELRTLHGSTLKVIEADRQQKKEEETKWEEEVKGARKKVYPNKLKDFKEIERAYKTVGHLQEIIQALHSRVEMVRPSCLSHFLCLHLFSSLFFALLSLLPSRSPPPFFSSPFLLGLTLPQADLVLSKVNEALNYQRFTGVEVISLVGPGLDVNPSERHKNALQIAQLVDSDTVKVTNIFSEEKDPDKLLDELTGRLQRAINDCPSDHLLIIVTEGMATKDGKLFLGEIDDNAMDLEEPSCISRRSIALDYSLFNAGSASQLLVSLVCAPNGAIVFPTVAPGKVIIRRIIVAPAATKVFEDKGNVAALAESMD